MSGDVMYQQIIHYRNQLIELKNNYDLDLEGKEYDEDGAVIDKPSAGSTLVANILYEAIPSHIQFALWQITKKRYPTLQEILKNI